MQMALEHPIKAVDFVGGPQHGLALAMTDGAEKPRRILVDTDGQLHPVMGELPTYVLGVDGKYHFELVR